MRISLEEAARVVGGRIIAHGKVGLLSVAADSREVSKGKLFVALRGDLLDGHDFVAGAFLRGAAAALVEREVAGATGPQITVDDTRAALLALGAWARDLVDPLVVGVTGSTGKTSTKDLLASIASRKFSTVASKLSYNTEVGVPLTLLSIGHGTQVVVCELGARGPGQIAALAEIARPQVGIVTNVGVTHFEQFGSKDAIADAKAELVEALPEGGTAILNADDPAVASMSQRTRAEVLTFGTSHRAWLRAENASIDERGRPTFRIARGPEGAWVTLEMIGRHQIMNALAASCAALALGMSLDDCRVGLESARGSPWRMEVHRAGGVTVVNDAYNANPDSMVAALETCAAMVPKGSRLIAVLGHMAELGELAGREHERAGEIAAASAQRLIVISEAASGISRGARRSGMEEVDEVADAAGALDLLEDLKDGDVVLVKASRVAALETLADQIEKRLTSKAGKGAIGR